MKGQFTWDYIVSIGAFIALVSYLSLQIVNTAPIGINTIKGEFLRSEAYQISELLINDPGEPKDWTTSNVERLGFANENFNITNYISSRKISDINTMCASNYENVANLLGIDMKNYNFSLVMIDRTDGNVIISDCKSPLLITKSINVTIKRYAAIDNGHYAEMILQTG